MAKPRKIEVEITDYLGTEKAYWHGNSLRIALPNDVVDAYKIFRERGNIDMNSSSEVKRAKFAFYQTDKGILVCFLDDVMKQKFKDALSFSGDISDEDLQFLFDKGAFP